MGSQETADEAVAVPSTILMSQASEEEIPSPGRPVQSLPDYSGNSVPSFTARMYRASEKLRGLGLGLSQ